MAKKKLSHDHSHDLETVLQNMPESDHFSDAAATFQQLCDGSRLRIFWLICHVEECVSNIATAVEMTDAAVSHHLRTLKMHNLIKSRRIGKEVHYSLEDNEKARLAYQMIDEYLHMAAMSSDI